jgi:hypothetical protein
MLQNTPDPQNPINWIVVAQEIIRTLAPIATLIISIINLRYALWMFEYKDNKEERDKSRTRNIDWFKKLIIDPNLSQFYDFFDNVETEYKQLTTGNCTEELKRKIESDTLQHQIKLRRNFISTLGVVDEFLYSFVEEKIDDLIGGINKSIFDEGINLTHRPMFEEKVLKPISDTRIEILKKVFEYSGESNRLLKL